MGKPNSARGLEIIAQGAAQYRAIFEESSNPFKLGKQDVERRLWLKGWLEAKFKWEKSTLGGKRFAKKFTKHTK